MAQLLDNNYVESVTRRLESIPDDATPAWGEMDKTALIEHLHWAVRASMGREGENPIPFKGNWVTRNIIRPLLVRGLVPIPKNIQMPREAAARGVTLRSPGSLADLRRTLEDFVTQYEAGTLECIPHPVFGDVGVDGWRRFHVLHFEHHCRQFGA